MTGYSVSMVVDGSSGAKDLEGDIATYLSRAFVIFKERQRKYGSGNIARRGPVGVLVRMDDKLARLDRLFMEGAGDTATDESVEDTCLDVANYALILLLCHAGKWPGWTPRPAAAIGQESPVAESGAPRSGTDSATDTGSGWQVDKTNYVKPRMSFP